MNQNYKLSLTPNFVNTVVHVSQYDHNSRTLVFELTADGQAVNIPATATVTIRGTKPDNTGFEYPCTVNGNIVTAPVKDQMTVIDGAFPVEIRITEGSSVLGTANFTLYVEKASLSADTVVSETDLPMLEEALQVVDQLTDIGNNRTASTFSDGVLYTVNYQQGEGTPQMANQIAENTSDVSTLKTYFAQGDINSDMTLYDRLMALPKGSVKVCRGWSVSCEDSPIKSGQVQFVMVRDYANDLYSYIIATNSQRMLVGKTSGTLMAWTELSKKSDVDNIGSFVIDTVTKSSLVGSASVQALYSNTMYNITGYFSIGTAGVKGDALLTFGHVKPRYLTPIILSPTGAYNANNPITLDFNTDGTLCVNGSSAGVTGYFSLGSLMGLMKQ